MIGSQQLKDIISSSDNVFKFTFITGLVIILLTLFYPLEKSYEIQLLVLENDEIVLIENIETKELDTEIANMQSTTDSLESLAERLTVLRLKTNNPTKNDSITNLIKSIKKEYYQYNTPLIKKIKEYTIRDIKHKSRKRKIKIMEDQISFFKQYSIVLLIFGLFLVILGYYNWFKSGRKDLKLKSLQINKHLEENGE